MSDFHDLFIPDAPITQCVILRRHPDGIETNVPHLVTHHSPTGYEWGYTFGGGGSADLALNILGAALQELQHKGESVECWRGDCFQLAWTLHHQFIFQFLTNMPHEGGVIYWPALKAWILDNATKKGICPYCGNWGMEVSRRSGLQPYICANCSEYWEAETKEMGG